MRPFVLPDLCDAHEGMVVALHPGLRNFGGRQCFYGPVRTIKCFEDNSLVAERVREPGDGHVLVVDGGGSMRCALLGDNLAYAAADNGWAGVVVYGCVRDVEELARVDMGIAALAAHPMRSVKRGEGQRDVPLGFLEARIFPDHFIYVDDNGAVVSPVALEI